MTYDIIDLINRQDQIYPVMLQKEPETLLQELHAVLEQPSFQNLE